MAEPRSPLNDSPNNSPSQRSSSANIESPAKPYVAHKELRLGEFGESGGASGATLDADDEHGAEIVKNDTFEGGQSRLTMNAEEEAPLYDNQSPDEESNYVDRNTEEMSDKRVGESGYTAHNEEERSHMQHDDEDEISDGRDSPVKETNYADDNQEELSDGHASRVVLDPAEVTSDYADSNQEEIPANSESAVRESECADSAAEKSQEFLQDSGEDTPDNRKSDVEPILDDDSPLLDDDEHTVLNNKSEDDGSVTHNASDADEDKTELDKIKDGNTFDQTESIIHSPESDPRDISDDVSKENVSSFGITDNADAEGICPKEQHNSNDHHSNQDLNNFSRGESLIQSDPIATNTSEEPHLENADLNASVPSPFSDLGDIDGNMSTTETAIVSDLMKEREDLHSSMDTTVANIAENVVGVEQDDAMDIDDDLESDQVDNQTTGQPEVVEGGNGEEGQDVGGLIADIFGESDEEEEFEGFADEELYPKKAGVSDHPTTSGDRGSEDSDEELTVPAPRDQGSENDDDAELQQNEREISDFDLMMQRKKEMSASRRRARKDFDIINDNDDIIAAMINQMKEAAEEDRLLNQNGKAATKKLAMLKTVVSHLRKVDLQNTFIDCGILPALKDWLTPLPDNSLPHSIIREQLLRIIHEFPAIDKGALKMSGIGRAVMLLYKHPRESRDNKKIASKIIAEWSRPIFGVTTKFTEMTREDREERDKMNVPANRKRRLSSAGGEGSSKDPEKRPRKPGDKGFISRARVPMPSNRDYVVRPVSELGDVVEFKKNAKKSANRFDKQYRKFKDKKALLSGNDRRAVKMSLNGSKLAL